MSPRRKPGLSKDDLEALKHLPAVLEAVRKVTALGVDLRAAVGAPGVTMPRWPAPFTPEASAEVDRQMEEAERGMQNRLATVNPTLDTPERREYDEAKRAGRKVPVADPFANASPAQRERMAEQRAIIDAERAARGMPGRGSLAPGVQRRLAEELPEPPADEVVVRTETLDTVSDGTTPLADDADGEEEIH